MFRQQPIGFGTIALLFFHSSAAVIPAATIHFDSTGIYREDFGPPNGAAGALLYRSTAAKSTGPAIAIPTTPLPGTITGTNLGANNSPIVTTDGNPGNAHIITYLSVGHGDLRVIQTGQTISGPAGSLTYTFSVSGFWEVLLPPCANGQMEVLDSVALDGAVAGDVRIDPPLFGSANASVSGTVNVGPFGSFTFGTGDKSGGGSAGISIGATSGGISVGAPPAGNTEAAITFTGLSNAIKPNTFYPFSMSGSLSASLSGTGITGTAFSIANIYQEEFNLTANTHMVPCPEPSSLAITCIGAAGLAFAACRRQRNVVRAR